MVEKEACAKVERSDRLHFFDGEFKPEDVEILCHSFSPRGLWNYHDPSLDQPSKNDLGDTFAVALGNR